LELGQSASAPQRGAQGEALVERDGLQAILDHRADADEPKPMLDQGA
jgi:hypothetical protein